MNIQFRLFCMSVCAALAFGCASADSERRMKKFYVVDGVISLNRRSDLPSNSWPWQKEKQSAIGNDFDGEVISFTHGCAFYDFEYSLQPLPGTREVLAVRTRPGEFCDVGEFAFSNPTLISVRYWEGVLYLEDFAPLVYNENDKAYIPGFYLPDSWVLNGLLEKYPGGEARSFCVYKEWLKPIVKHQMLESAYIEEFDDELCHSHLLPLEELVEAGLL